jgi:hypothetical protein
MSQPLKTSQTLKSSGVNQNTTTTTVYSPSRLGSYGISQWLGTDLERLYIQYPQLFSKDDILKGKLSLHSNIINENIDLRSSNAALAKEVELLKLSGKRITEADSRITVLVGENQNTSLLLGEKGKECDTWKYKFATADEEAHRANVKVNVLSRENQHLVEEATATKEQLAKYELLKVHFAHLSAEYNALGQQRDQLVLLNQEKDRQSALLIAERERTISELSVKIGSSSTTITDYEATKNKVLAYAAENERLAGVIGEQLKTIDGLRFRIAQLTEVESSLAVTAEEKSRLLATLTEKLAEIDALKAQLVDARNWEMRFRSVSGDKDQLLATLSDKLKLIDTMNLQIASLQIEVAKIPELQSKIAVLLADNERLNITLIEKIRIIDEWAVRYSSLEQLYLNIKETTEQLDFVKRKYETVVTTHQQKEAELRASSELRKSQTILRTTTTQ